MDGRYWHSSEKKGQQILKIYNCSIIYLGTKGFFLIKYLRISCYDLWGLFLIAIKKKEKKKKEVCL